MITVNLAEQLIFATQIAEAMAYLVEQVCRRCKTPAPPVQPAFRLSYLLPPPFPLAHCPHGSGCAQLPAAPE